MTGNSSGFSGPPPEDLSATTNSSVEVQLTATDKAGWAFVSWSDRGGRTHTVGSGSAAAYTATYRAVAP